MQALAIALAVLAMASSIHAIEPAFRVALTNKGLEYGRDVLLPILEKELQNLQIPDISGSASTPVGSIDYDLSSIKASQISLGQTNLAIATSGVTASTSSVSVKMTAHWHYREHSWPHVSDSGSVDIGASGASMSVTVALGMTSKNEPSVASGACAADIGNLDLDFHGGASWLYNLFKSEIEGAVKDSLKGQLCTIIKREIDTEGNKALSTLPVQEPLDEYAVINFELVAAPELTSEFILTSHKGEFFNTQNPVEAPYTPTPLPNPAPGSLTRMMYIFMSEYVFETAGFVYQRAGYLNYNVTPAIVPSSSPIQLNTTDLALLVPALYKKYPNRALNLTLSALSPFIDLDIQPTAVNLTARVGVTPVVLLDGGQGVEAFTINTTVHATAEATIHVDGKKNSITGNITFVKVDIVLDSSNIGPINVNSLQNSVNFLAQKLIIPELNKICAKGFPIPSIDGLSFVNPQVSYADGSIIVDTDFNYTPTF